MRLGDGSPSWHFSRLTGWQQWGGEKNGDVDTQNGEERRSSIVSERALKLQESLQEGG